LVGDHDAGGQHHPEPEPEHPCSILGQSSRSGRPAFNSAESAMIRKLDEQRR
jgi:hypothetical protein